MLLGPSWCADRPLDRRVAAYTEYGVRARHRQAMVEEQVGTAPNLSNNPSLSGLEQYAVFAYFCGSAVADTPDGSVFVVSSTDADASPQARPQACPRRALELLASCRDGCTEAMMLAHGFTIEQICKLVYGGAHDDDLGTALFGRPLRRA